MRRIILSILLIIMTYCSDSKNVDMLKKHIENSDWKQAKNLVAKLGDVNVKNSKGPTLLHFLLNQKIPDSSLAIALIDKGSDISAVDNNGNTALHLTHSKKIASYLIKKGANAKAKNHGGAIPLVSSLALGETEFGLVLLYIKHGIDLNFQDDSGKTALHYAMERELYEVGVLLIKNGADIYIKDKQGLSPKDLNKLQKIRKKKSTNKS